MYALKSLFLTSLLLIGLNAFADPTELLDPAVEQTESLTPVITKKKILKRVVLESVTTRKNGQSTALFLESEARKRNIHLRVIGELPIGSHYGVVPNSYFIIETEKAGYRLMQKKLASSHVKVLRSAEHEKRLMQAIAEFPHRKTPLSNVLKLVGKARFDKFDAHLQKAVGQRLAFLMFPTLSFVEDLHRNDVFARHASKTINLVMPNSTKLLKDTYVQVQRLASSLQDSMAFLPNERERHVEELVAKVTGLNKALSMGMLDSEVSVAIELYPGERNLSFSNDLVNKGFFKDFETRTLYGDIRQLELLELSRRIEIKSISLVR